ncbi:MAG: zf-HC2 domain-containing protein [Gemmatimonadota bacterium]
MSEHLNDRTLQMHLDGDLSGAARWDVEAHLRHCPDCRLRAESYRVLLDEIHARPARIDPPHDLWPGIVARIQGSGNDAPIPIGGKADRDKLPIRGRVVLVWAMGVAAALVIGIGLGRQLAEQSPQLRLPATAAAPAEPVAVLASYDEPAYQAAVTDLEMILVQMRDELRPETVEAVEENLAIIDQAIEDARAALLADPVNESLHRHLAANMQMKLSVLRMVTGAVTAEI